MISVVLIQFVVVASDSKVPEDHCRDVCLIISIISYVQIEEVGWEHLVRLSEDLKSLSFRVV